MAKTHKSILKRMRITKRGQILRGASGINHFQAKKSRASQLNKKRQTTIGKTQSAMLKSYLYR